MAYILPPGAKASALGETLRPKAILLPWFIADSVVFAYQGLHANLVFAFFILLVTYGAVTIQNDLSDYAVDKLNKREDVPLAAGRLSHHEARMYLLVLTLIATMLTLFIGGREGVAWLIVYMCFGWLYSGRPNFKAKGFLALVPLGFCYGFMPWWLGRILGGTPWNAALITGAIATFVFTVGVIGYKDFKDYAGDKQLGKRTILIQYGPKFVQQFSIWGVLLAYAVILFYGLKNGGPIWLACFEILALGVSIFLLSKVAMVKNARFRKKAGAKIRLCFVIFVILHFLVFR